VRARLAGALAAALVATALAAAGCGGDGSGGRPTVTVALDFTPNPVHAPVYAAVRKGYDRDEGVRLRIRPPGSRPDSLKLLEAGRADLAVLDIQDLAIAREHGTDVVGVAALVQRPLGALIAQADVPRPRALDGRRVGVSGLPSDPAFVRAIVEHDGGDYGSIRQVVIGFNAVGSLLAKKVDAVPAFWNAEGVTLHHRGARTREFRVDDYGAPRYPEVVLVATRATLARRRGTIARAVESIRRGTGSVLAEPEPAAREIAHAGRSDLDLVREQLAAVSPALRPPLVLDRDALERWAAFDEDIGIVDRRPDVARSFDFSIVRAGEPAR
jgi:putative hydroxymethylpyrimidine transport system substrate-binding protein